MARNGCRMRKAEINQIIFTDSRRLADINTQLNQLKNQGTRSPHKPSVSPEQQARATRRVDASSLPHRSTSKRLTYGVAVRGKSRVSYGRNRPDRAHPGARAAHPDAARKLARLLARGTPISRLAQGNHFRRGQLLVRALRALRAIIPALEIEQRQPTRNGMKL